MQKNYMQAYGKQIHQTGYNIVPIMPGSKKPGQWRSEGWVPMSGWSRFCSERPADGLVDMWANWPGCGIGIACGTVVAIDIDIEDADVADDVEIIVQQLLGKTPLRRVGKAPKCLLVYRAAEPFKKMKAGPIEALCDGQQFVAYSIHPGTGSEYTWTNDNPYDIPLGLLPRVTQDQVAKALQVAFEALPEELRAKMPRVIDFEDRLGAEPGELTSERGLTAHQDAILDAIQCIENPDLHWDDWNKVGMALWASSGGAEWAREAFHAFSNKSDKNNASETQERWESYFRSKPHSVGAGTIFKFARDNGWFPPVGLDFHEGAVDLTEIAGEVEALVSRPALTVIEGGHDVEAGSDPDQPDVAPSDGFTLPSGEFPFNAWFEDESRGAISQVAKWIYSTAPRPHPELALANTLTMFGALFGRNYKMAKLSTRTNMLTIGVAPTGSGKEYSRSCIKRLMEAAKLERVVGGDDIKSGPAVESMLKEYPSRINMIDEFGMFLSGIINEKANGYTREVGRKILEFYSASASMYRGSQYADIKAKPSITIYNPIWCIYGTTTMDTLRPVLQNSTQQDGTLPRMLFFDANKRPAQRFDVDTTQPPPESVVDFLMSISSAMPNMVGDLGALGMSGDPVEAKIVQWSEPAFEMYKAMSLWCDEMVSRRGVVWTRVMENTVKVAMVDAITTTDLFNPEVRVKSLQKAFDLVYWCTTFLERMISDEGAENETEAVQKRVWRIIGENEGSDGVSGELLARKTQFLKGRDRHDVIESLKEANKIREIRIKTGKPGKPPVRYFAIR